MSDLLEKLRTLDSLCPPPMSEPVYMGAQVYVDRQETLAMLDRGQTVVIGRGTLREIIAALEGQP